MIRDDHTLQSTAHLFFKIGVPVCVECFSKVFSERFEFEHVTCIYACFRHFKRATGDPVAIE